MKSLRERFHPREGGDTGVSLIEVMVAMFIFALISIGVIYTMTSSLTLVRESQARSAASNLAAQEIDTARAAPKLFELFDKTYDQTVDGRTYTVTREVRWVSDPKKDVPCGATGGSLQYKRVNVIVTWKGMTDVRNPARADTLLAPLTRVSQPDQATILVSVVDAASVGLRDVVITTSPSLTAPKTDEQGCAYLVNVPPGTYTVSVKKAGHVDPSLDEQPEQTITLTAGGSVNTPFQLAVKKPLTLNYGSTAAKIPTNLDTSLLHSSDPPRNSLAGNATKTRTVDLFPFAYQGVAGRYLPRNEGSLGCLSPNPDAWAPTEADGVTLTSPLSTSVVPAAGATLTVPMGAVTVAGPSGGGSLTAVSQKAAPSGSADPGCAVGVMTYTFGSVLTANTQTEILLPYGTWKLYYNNTGTGTAVGASNITVASAPSLVTAVNGEGIVTLDPRVASTVAP